MVKFLRNVTCKYFIALFLYLFFFLIWLFNDCFTFSIVFIQCIFSFLYWLYNDVKQTSKCGLFYYNLHILTENLNQNLPSTNSFKNSPCMIHVKNHNRPNVSVKGSPSRNYFDIFSFWQRVHKKPTFENRKYPSRSIMNKTICFSLILGNNPQENLIRDIPKLLVANIRSRNVCWPII